MKRQAEIFNQAEISHGFYNREGGLSAAPYESLNTGLGSNDDPQNVIENRARIARDLGVDPSRLASPYLIHSNICHIVTDATTERPKGDAVVTNQRGLALGVLHADCGPVLFHDSEAGVIGAAHAGWRGAFTGILESTIEAMESLGATRGTIKAALGPTIHQASYEVSSGFRDDFLKKNVAFDAYFLPGKDGEHFQFDLPSFIMKRLEDAGVDAENLRCCTYSDRTDYGAAEWFSYRRSQHENLGDYGRHMSAIALRGEA